MGIYIGLCECTHHAVKGWIGGIGLDGLFGLGIGLWSMLGGIFCGGFVVWVIVVMCLYLIILFA